METNPSGSKGTEQSEIHQSTQKDFPETGEDTFLNNRKLDIQEEVSSKIKETTLKSEINDFITQKESDCMKVEIQNDAEKIKEDNQANIDPSATRNQKTKDRMETEEQVAQTLEFEANSSMTQKESGNTECGESLIEENSKSEDVMMDADPSNSVEATEPSSTDKVISSITTSETSSKSEIKIPSCEIIKSPLNSSNSPPAVSNSLGLSLVASEYASTEESEEDPSSSEDDDEDSDFDSDESDDDDDDDTSSTQSAPRKAADNLDAIANEIELVTNSQAYRDQVVEIDSDINSSDSTDVEIVSQTTRNPEPIELDDDDNEDGDGDDSGRKGRKGKQQNGPLRVKGELLLEDLPPIEDLHITVPENECEEFGKIHSIVDQLVLVESKPEAILLDLETVLFLEKGHKVLGKVFDVLGQVTSPWYCIRFNSNKQIKEKCIEIGQTVYVAPKTEHTQFLILTKLVSMRGSDASWENDVEPPENHLDYSDDEQERTARKALRNRQNNSEGGEGGRRDDDEESSVQDDVESIASDSTVLSQRPRKRKFSQPRHSYGYQQNQGYNYSSPYASPAPGYHQNYPLPSGYNPHFHRNPPLPGSPFYNSAYNSWHSNFNPYNQFNGNYQIPFPPVHMQQPLYPPNQGGFRQPPPPPWNNQ